MRRFLAFVLFVSVFTGLLVGCGKEEIKPPPRGEPLKQKEGEEKPAKVKHET